MSSSAITRPLIGLTSYVERVRWGPWDKPAVLVPLTYVGAVERAGGEPVLLPSTGSARPEFVRSLDGLVVIGGNDINPETYGTERHPETTRVRERRDRSELEVLRDALDAKVPVLGICRGMQLLNVVRGGDLVQHLADSRPGDLHKRAPGVYT
ncbi:MAG: gamma-glutamyl-gamma-aminobutyrate hydrolase family protein, partial [Actinobacteria bacterium]|nr:gamma-glutamyl-gamma-aminobutyrate hydrolase family protein [Actinomycetota bacterium]